MQGSIILAAMLHHKPLELAARLVNLTCHLLECLGHIAAIGADLQAHTCTCNCVYQYVHTNVLLCAIVGSSVDNEAEISTALVLIGYVPHGVHCIASLNHYWKTHLGSYIAELVQQLLGLMGDGDVDRNGEERQLAQPIGYA